MKKFLLSTTALLGLTAGSLAADLPYRKAPAPYVAVPVFTWTGFYVGVNAGYGFSDSGRNALGTFTAVPGSLSAPLGGYTGVVTNTGIAGGSRDGFVGGGQIGYNYQIGGLVIGIEADAQYADLGRRRNGGVIVLTPGVVGFSGAVNSNFGGIDWFGTVRGRVGYAWDRLLVYGTGGLAYGDGGGNNNVGLLANGAVIGGIGGRNDDLRIGWTAGGGVEYAFTPNLSAKVEGLYVSLEQTRNTNFIGAVGATPVFVVGGRRGTDNDFAVVRAGLNYKFSWY